MQADLALQQVTLKRQKELFAGKAATAQTLDEARAKQAVSMPSGDRESKITSAEADLQVAKAEAKRVQALLQYDKIVAPFDGVVTRRLVNPGDLVGGDLHPHGPAVHLQKLDIVRVSADAPEASAAGIRPGLPADVKLYGPDGATVHGTRHPRRSRARSCNTHDGVEIDLPNPTRSCCRGCMRR